MEQQYKAETPHYVSLSKRKRENKELAKQMGMERYKGGGYNVDQRWKNDQKAEDGNSERVSFLRKLKLASFAPLE